MLFPRRFPALGAGLLGLLTIFGALRGGADTPHYRSWAIAMAKGDPWLVSPEYREPAALAYSFWSHGPALLSAPLVWMSGWSGFFLVATAVFVLFGWAALFSTMAKICGPTKALILSGLLALGTPAGLYTFHISSEGLSFAFLSILALLAIQPGPSRGWQAAIFGTMLALFVLVRNQNLVLALPVLLLALWRDRRDGVCRNNLPWLSLPLFFGLLQQFAVNRWMTGSAFKSVYLFEGGTFKSVAIENALGGELFFHPWHGLFPYHPLFIPALTSGVLLVALPNRHRHMAWLSLLCVCVFAIICASWYCWWNGASSFGARCFTPCAVPAGIALAWALRPARPAPIRLALWICIALSLLWSYLLFRMNILHYTNFYFWDSLLARVAEEGLRCLRDPAWWVILSATLIACLVLGLSGALRPINAFRLLLPSLLCSLFLVTGPAVVLQHRILGPASLVLLHAGILSLLVPGALVALCRMNLARLLTSKIFGGVCLLLFATSTLLLARLVLARENLHLPISHRAILLNQQHCIRECPNVPEFQSLRRRMALLIEARQPDASSP